MLLMLSLSLNSKVLNSQYIIIYHLFLFKVVKKFKFQSSQQSTYSYYKLLYNSLSASSFRQPPKAAPSLAPSIPALTGSSEREAEKRFFSYNRAISDVEGAEIFSLGFPPEEKTSEYFQKPPSELWSSKKIKDLLFSDPPTNGFSLIFQKTCLIIQFPARNSG